MYNGSSDLCTASFLSSTRHSQDAELRIQSTAHTPQDSDTPTKRNRTIETTSQSIVTRKLPEPDQIIGHPRAARLKPPFAAQFQETGSSANAHNLDRGHSGAAPSAHTYGHAHASMSQISRSCDRGHPSMSPSKGRPSMSSFNRLHDSQECTSTSPHSETLSVFENSSTRSAEGRADVSLSAGPADSDVKQTIHTAWQAGALLSPIKVIDGASGAGNGFSCGKGEFAAHALSPAGRDGGLLARGTQVLTGHPSMSVGQSRVTSAQRRKSFGAHALQSPDSDIEAERERHVPGPDAAGAYSSPAKSLAGKLFVSESPFAAEERFDIPPSDLLVCQAEIGRERTPPQQNAHPKNVSKRQPFGPGSLGQKRHYTGGPTWKSPVPSAIDRRARADEASRLAGGSTSQRQLDPGGTPSGSKGGVAGVDAWTSVS